MQTRNSKRGFSLIELIIYIAISVIALTLAVNAGISLVKSEANAKAKQEVYFNARSVFGEIQLQMKNASDVIVGSSIFDTNPGVLTLDFQESSTTAVFDTYTKNVTVGGTEVQIRKLQLTEGSSPPIDLTTDEVNLSNLTFRNYTRGNGKKSIKIELSLEKVNPGGDPNYDADISLETAITLRR